MRGCPRCGLPADYIPGGVPVYKVTNLRPVGSYEFAQCGVSVGNDIQSGPLYCGDRATWKADSADSGKTGTAYACDRHRRILERRVTP